MRLLFRVDASVEIGTGHVMRCLTLADALREKGARSTFVCRAHAGHLGEMIEARGHPVRLLEPGGAPDEDNALAHAAWLGAGQADDARACAAIARAVQPDWLVVDHYALDARWEAVLRPHVGRIMVIDDLADRAHDCDLLLDQNLGRTPEAYATRVPAETPVLAGPDFALLRPAFASLRPASLTRREADGPVRSVLVALGGIDKDNYTRATLTLLAAGDLSRDAVVTVVLGGASPWIDDISYLAGALPWRTEVLIQSDRMAELMVEADVAIGAAGATTWERCCLGVPSALWVMADNQRAIASAIEDAGAGLLLDPAATGASMSERLDRFLQDRPALARMSRRAATLVDGLGVNRVIQALTLYEQRS